MPRISVITPTIRPEGLRVTMECLRNQTFQDFEWLVEVGTPWKGNDLNQAYNRMLRRAKGELMVSLQDFIRIEEKGLAAFWDAYQANPDTFFTAPVGKVAEWGAEPVWDWRIHPQTKPDWMQWEIDWGAAPIEALYRIGGFDEELDLHTWTFDNVNVGLRADMAGYKFGHLPGNRAIALDHDLHEEHPFRGKKYDPGFHNQRLQEIRMGKVINNLAV